MFVDNYLQRSGVTEHHVAGQVANLDLQAYTFPRPCLGNAWFHVPSPKKFPPRALRAAIAVDDFDCSMESWRHPYKSATYGMSRHLLCDAPGGMSFPILEEA